MKLIALDAFFLNFQTLKEGCTQSVAAQATSDGASQPQCYPHYKEHEGLPQTGGQDEGQLQVFMPFFYFTRHQNDR